MASPNRAPAGLEDAVSLLVWLPVVLLIATVPIAFAQGAYYTSRSAYESALSSSTTITFEDLPLTPLQGAGLRSVTTSGVAFTNASGYLYIGGGREDIYSIDGKYLRNFDNWLPVTVLLPPGVTAFGADLSGGIEPYPTFNATVTVNLASGGSEAFHFSAADDAWVFFGVTFPEPISSLVYDDGGFYHEEKFDNVTFGTVVPEPAGFAFLVTGLLLFGLSRQRRT